MEIHAPHTQKSRLAVALVIAFGLCLAAIHAFLAIARAIDAKGALATLDGRISHSLVSTASPTGVRVFTWITSLGDPLTVIAITVSVGIGLLLMKRFVWAIAWGFGLGGAAIFSRTLKDAFQRPRPSVFHVTTGSFSYPSAHALGGIVLYGLLAYMLARLVTRTWQRVAIVATATLVVLAIGFSRVYLGAHYPTDVAGGWLVGGVWVAVSIGVMEYIRHHQVQRQGPAPASELPHLAGTEADTAES